MATTTATATIALSTKDGYPATYISSENFNIEGWDAFISIDYRTEPYPATGKPGSGKPQVNLIGFAITATKRAPLPKISVGDTVKIGNTVYELVAKRSRFVGNGDIELVPVS